MVNSGGENLVFLLSLPRSGSTILSLVLAGHSKVSCPPEPWFLLKLSALGSDGSASSRFDDNLATIGSASFLRGGTIIASSRAFAIAAYNEKLNDERKQIFVDKTPRYYHILAFLDELFPKAKKIWLKRNPLDVAASYKRQWGVGIDMITGRSPNFASYDFSLGLFELESYFSRPSAYKCQISYEALVESPEKILRQLCKFLKIPFEHRMLDFSENTKVLSQHRHSEFGDKGALKTSSVHSAAVGKWVETLTVREVQRLMSFLGMGIFRKLGYDEDVRESLLRMRVRIPVEKTARARRQKAIRRNHDPVRELNRIAQARLKEMQLKEREIARMHRDGSLRLAELGALTTQLRVKEEELKKVHVEAQRRLTEMQEKDAEMKCLSVHLRSLQKELEVHAKVRKSQDEILLQREKDLKSQEEAIVKISWEAELRSSQVERMSKALDVERKESADLRAAILVIEKSLTGKEGQMSMLAEGRKNLEKMLRERDEMLKEKEAEINNVSSEAEIRRLQMKRMADALKSKESAFATLERTSQERLQALEKSLKEKEGQINLLSEARQNLEMMLKERDLMVREKEEGINNITREAEKRLEEMRKMSDQLKLKEAALTKMQQAAQERLQVIQEKEKEISQLLNPPQSGQ